MKLLSRSEEIVLITILKLKDNAYGVAIRKKLHEETGTQEPNGHLVPFTRRLTH